MSSEKLSDLCLCPKYGTIKHWKCVGLVFYNLLISLLSLLLGLQYQRFLSAKLLTKATEAEMNQNWERANLLTALHFASHITVTNKGRKSPFNSWTPLFKFGIHPPTQPSMDHLTLKLPLDPAFNGPFYEFLNNLNGTKDPLTTKYSINW